MSLVKVKNLSVNYEQSFVFSALNFNVEKGDLLAIIGHNGQGKSTLLKIIAGEITHFEGECWVKNDSSKLQTNFFKSGILSVLNQQNEIPFEITVQDLILMGRFRFKIFLKDYSPEDHLMVQNAAKNLQIEHLLKRNYNSLSGGEKQLVLIAQTIAQDTEIILLDEPTQNLDIKNAYKVFEHIFKLNKLGKTIILSTHDLFLLRDFSDGKLFNLSRKNPEFVSLNSENIDKEIDFLKGKINAI